jgi:hypothetical protein
MLRELRSAIKAEFKVESKAMGEHESTKGRKLETGKADHGNTEWGKHGRGSFGVSVPQWFRD